MSYEVRFENGASMGIDVTVKTAAEAERIAVEGLRSCVPDEMKDNLVGVSIVRACNACSLCGRKAPWTEVISINLPLGQSTMICHQCGEMVHRTYTAFVQG